MSNSYCNQSTISELKSYTNSISKNLPINKINEVIDNVNSNAFCDPQCQHERENQRLWSIYVKKKGIAITAPGHRDVAYEKYYVHKYGRAEYTEYLKREAWKRVNKLGEEFRNDFNKRKEEIIHLMKDVNSQTMSLKRLTELLKKYGRNNMKLHESIGKLQNSSDLNHRLTYYVDDEEGTYINWNKFFNVIFWIVFSLYILIVLLINKKYNNKICLLTAFSFILFFLFIKFLLPKLVLYFFLMVKPIEGDKIKRYPDISYNDEGEKYPSIDKLKYFMKGYGDEDDRSNNDGDKKVGHSHLVTHKHVKPGTKH